jgi:hypothetical protein
MTVRAKPRTVPCRACRTNFKRPKGTNRLFCYECRPSRVGKTVVVDPAEQRVAEPVELPPPAPREPGPLELAAVGELTRTGRLATVKGQIAVRLARALDDPELPDARLSTLGAQLERTMDAATAGAPPPPDGLDELGERRRQLAAGA